MAILENPLEGTFSFELRKASAALMMALSNELEALELKPSEASLLMMIGANPGCTQSDIGRAMRTQPANLVPLINRLMRAQALERAPAEGRSIALFLTKDGVALHKQVKSAVARVEKRITRNVPKPLQSEVIEVLRLITNNACRHDR